EFLQAHLAALHHVQRLFPDRRGAWVGNRPWYGVDQAEGRRAGRQRLALFAQVAAIEQPLDDAGPCRFGADAGGVLELLLQARVVHQFGDVLHRLDQVAFGEGLGRLGPEILEVYANDVAVLAFAQRRQCLGRGRLATLGGRQGFGQRAAPAWLDDHLAHRPQRLPGAVEVGLGAVVFVVGQELRQVAGANQRIDRALLARQPRQIGSGGGGDDAVVGADLAIVPGARAALWLYMCEQFGQRRVVATQGGDNRRRLAVLAQRQVAAVTARVGDELVGFVERLGDIQGFLGAEAEFLRADFLQGAEVEGQRRRLAHAFGAQLHHLCLGGIADGGGCLARMFRVEAAPLVVAAIIGCAPLRGEGYIAGLQRDLDGPVGNRHEV